MKKIYAFILFAVSFMASAQCPPGNVTLYNQAQVDSFLASYPNCTQINGSLILEPGAVIGTITNLNGLQNITTITGSLRLEEHDVQLANFNGLNNLTYVGGSIFIVDTWVNNISALSNITYVGGDIDIRSNGIGNFAPLNNITHVGGNVTITNDSDYCSISGLEFNFTHVPGNLNFGLDCNQENTIQALHNIVSVGGDFSLGHGGITDLAPLSSLHSVGGMLTLNGMSSLQTLNGLQNMTSMGGLYINSAPNLTDISALSQITSLYDGLYISSTGLTSLEGLENVTTIGNGLGIMFNDSLTSLNDLSGAAFSGVEDVSIYVNPLLEYCNQLNLCNYLANGGEYDITGNAPGCDTIDEVTENCNLTWKNRIEGYLRLDYDGNGCTASDMAVTNRMVRATSGGNQYSTFTDANGYYRLFVPSGIFFMSGDNYFTNYQTQASQLYVTFEGVGELATSNFCAVPSATVSDARIQVIPLNTARPGFNASYRIIITNPGTVALNGSVTLAYNDAMMDFTSASMAPSAQSSGLLAWDYSNLMPLEVRNITVNYNILTPPTVQGGDVASFTATVNPVTGDATPTNNVYTYNNTIVNSYDPNDKDALQGDMILAPNLQKPIDYKIRFQNTGTASAINIKITDTINNQFDINSIQLVALSHPGRMQVNGQTVEFVFDGINLPHSSENEPASHGYAIFRINPMSNIAIGQTIENTANIYFDFNAPIITNTDQIYIDADSDNDGVLNSVDNCPQTANPDQADSDSDGFGDVCDDGLEVYPPYEIGFDTPAMDTLWKSYKQHNTYCSVTVDNGNDVDGNGKTIKLRSQYGSYRTMLISPRLMNVGTESTISFWYKREESGMYPMEIGFMTNPLDPATFTRLKYLPNVYTMTEYTLDMATYQAAHGKNLAIALKGAVAYVDDFIYTNPPLSNEDVLANGLSVYPNPARDILEIAYTQGIDGYEIIDINGRTFKGRPVAPGSANVSVDISSLTGGIYFLKITSGGKSQTQKFIKQ